MTRLERYGSFMCFGLLEMLIPITLGLSYIAVRRYREMARPYTYLLAGAFMGLALLFSVSRMGIFSFLLTILFLAVLLRLRDSKNRVATGLGLTFIVLLTAGAPWIGINLQIPSNAMLFFSFVGIAFAQSFRAADYAD